MEIPRAVLERLSSGDPDAFARVVELCAPKVRGIVARYFRGVFDQEEAMQEVWIQLYRNREALDLERAERFSGWLATLAHRRCIDLLRRAKGAPPLADGEPFEIADEEPGPDPAELRELEDAVHAFRERLDGHWREMFVLHFVHGLAYADVAERLGVTQLRCKYMKKVLVARARKNRPLLEALGRFANAPKGGAHAR